MKYQRQTTSLCNTCYKEIPAIVTVGRDGVYLNKCCSAHGEQEGLVEQDPVFYSMISALGSTNIYNGHFIDVTRRCNLRCQFCYYALEHKDPVDMFSVEEILDECHVNRLRAPFILTGGEPTLHPNITEIIERANQIAPVELLTNGVKLADPHFFSLVMPLITRGRVANLNLSIHKETDAWKDVLGMCRGNTMVESCLIVVDSQQSFLEALAIADQYRDVVLSWRIKAATRIWAEQKPLPEHRVFVSDMLNWLEEEGGTPELVTQKRCNKSVFANVLWKELFLMLVSWHDVTNVDLMDIACPPTYRARNGEIQNFVYTGLINEGLTKGWLHGRKCKLE